MELTIESVEDVLPHIVPDTGIIHSRHDGYSVINYVFTVDNTFDSAMARECRGLKFDADGVLIARPFHKFFNLGEKRPPHEEPWSDPHVVLDKLDGSMVHPALVGGEMVFMTRMGLSTQAKAAFKAASSDIRDLCKDMLAAGLTPVFEFTSPDHRLVVAYEKPELTLLAIRHMRSGAYMPHNEMGALAKKYGVRQAAMFGTVEEVKRFWEEARALEGVEGYVVAFEDGHRVKVKADAYVLRHKALAGLAHEKNLLAWVATGAVDDVLPLLAPAAADVVRDYHDQVTAAVSRHEKEIGLFVAENRELPRKEFAAKVNASLDSRLRTVAFKALDGFPPRKSLMALLTRAAGSDTKVDAVRDLFEMEWEPFDSPDEG